MYCHLEDLNRLEKWINWNFMKSDKDERKILHLGKNNPRHQYRLGAGQPESTFIGKDLRVLENKLTVTQ